MTLESFPRRFVYAQEDQTAWTLQIINRGIFSTSIMVESSNILCLRRRLLPSNENLDGPSRVPRRYSLLHRGSCELGPLGRLDLVHRHDGCRRYEDMSDGKVAQL